MKNPICKIHKTYLKTIYYKTTHKGKSTIDKRKNTTKQLTNKIEGYLFCIECQKLYEK